MSSSGCRDNDARAGFTLIEVLVALALVLAFAAALGPLLFQARRVLNHGDGRIAAYVLLRALLDARADPAALANEPRDGEREGLRWHIKAEPMDAGAVFDDRSRTLDEALSHPHRSTWVAYRVMVSVWWAPGQVISAETMRLGRPQ